MLLAQPAELKTSGQHMEILEELMHEETELFCNEKRCSADQWHQ